MSNARLAHGTKFMAGDGTGAAAKAIAAAPIGAVRSANVVTITTTVAHGLAVNDEVTVAGVTDASFNGTFLVASIPLSTTFTYRQVAIDATSGGGTATKVQSFTAVAELRNILPAPKELQLADKTNHDSPDAYMEFIAGRRTAAAASISGWFTDDTVKTQMENDQDAGTKRDYAVLLPTDYGYWRFSGFVASLDRAAPLDDPLSFAASVGVTGTSTFTKTRPEA